MQIARLFGLCLVLASGPALAGAAVEDEGPLGPCVRGDSTTSGQGQTGPAWGVEIATSFAKQEALDDFARVQKQYSDLLGSYQPLVVEDCNLHMGTSPQYSARIGFDSRDDADALCAKLRSAGGACIVQKN
ncbi:SPOR domain-containing protein [Methyloceanibacter sp.]|uniref:SPOR domain-containing protein n=1 Tax=Methyloceanibacter sp. TaxID=1965321 RepID=UPI002D661760|nr:SPOR domain-containing protein [Methyloceanibacter sp.]HZP09767.1 SPOR domain-containing protein [Methyloceanibacter sp.]